jgi:tryptophan-rich sensory protein
VGIAGALYASPMMQIWYEALNKPEFTPPDPLFIPMGIFMYFLLSLTMYSLWSADPYMREDTKTAVYLFVFGLALNFLWFYAFFGLQSPFISLLIMIMLIAILLSNIYLASHVSLPAAVALVPYLGGCIGIIVINYFIYIMNPQLPLFVM